MCTETQTGVPKRGNKWHGTAASFSQWGTPCSNRNIIKNRRHNSGPRPTNITSTITPKCKCQPFYRRLNDNTIPTNSTNNTNNIHFLSTLYTSNCKATKNCTPININRKDQQYSNCVRFIKYVTTTNGKTTTYPNSEGLKNCQCNVPITSTNLQPTKQENTYLIKVTTIYQKNCPTKRKRPNSTDTRPISIISPNPMQSILYRHNESI